MIKKLMAVWFGLALVLVLSAPMSAQSGSKSDETKDTAKAEKGSKTSGETRYEGTVVRTSMEKSTLTIRKSGETGLERIIHYDSSTRWVSQEHGSKTANDIDASQVKDGDRVIVKGTVDKKGEFHASLISKRLTPQATMR